jgi:hypothetical protein
MTDERFESKLDRELTAFADEGVRPVDARALALEVVTAGRPAPWVANVSRVRWLLVAAALIALAILVVALATGISERERLGPLAFVRGGDLWVADASGSGQRRIAVAGAAQQEYIDVLWAPDGRHLAAVRDLGDDHGVVPAVEVFDDRGHLEWTKQVEPGGLPDLSWAPDSRRIAIAAFPTNRPTEGDLLAPWPPDVVTPMTLTVYGLDGREWPTIRAAAPASVRPPDPHAPLWADPWIRWSPSGDAIAVRAVSATPGDLGLWIISEDGSERRRVLDPGAEVMPGWFGWRSDGTGIDVTGPTGDPDCPTGMTIKGVCTPGYWTLSELGGSVVFAPLPNVPDILQATQGCSTRISWAGDQRRIAVGWRRDEVVSQDPLLIQTTASIGVVDRAKSSITVVATGTWRDDGRGGLTDIRGDPLDTHLIDWSGDGKRLFWMSPNAAGVYSAVFAAGSDGTSRPELVVDGVSHFDLAPGGPPT